MDLETINKQYDSVSAIFNSVLRGINAQWRAGQMTDQDHREAGAELDRALATNGTAEAQITAIQAVASRWIIDNPSFLQRL